MDAQILVADSAQTTPDGKVHALGLGWSNTTTPLPPQAVVVFIKCPWDQTNDTHTVAIEMVDADGKSVEFPGPPDGALQRVRIEGEFETGRPPGIRKGTPIDVPLAFNLDGGMPLPPGRYAWELSIDDEKKESWRVAFDVRAR